MYDFNDGQPLSGLLEQLKGAAVVVREGVVTEYNSAASRILPELREGDRAGEPEQGVIVLCGRSFEAVKYSVGEEDIYTFAVPMQTAVETALPLLGNLGMAIMESLSSAFVATELIAGTAEREGLKSLARDNAILRHEQYKLLHIAENLRELCALSEPDALSMSLFELDELCGRVMDSVRSLVADKGLVLSFNCEGHDFMTYADERRVERMLLAVLANSVGNCGPGCGVSLNLKREGGSFYMHIEDDGSGLPKEPDFDAFESPVRPIESGTSSHGMGLSLNVARNVAQRHGGSLALSSIPGQGTRVLITLPAELPGDTRFCSSRVDYAGNSPRQLLTEFAGVLDYKYYVRAFL